MTTRTIYSCDRCKEEFPQYTKLLKLIIPNVQYDLCEDCYSVFKKYLLGFLKIKKSTKS